MYIYFIIWFLYFTINYVLGGLCVSWGCYFFSRNITCNRGFCIDFADTNPKMTRYWIEKRKKVDENLWGTEVEWCGEVCVEPQKVRLTKAGVAGGVVPELWQCEADYFCPAALFLPVNSSFHPFSLSLFPRCVSFLKVKKLHFSSFPALFWRTYVPLEEVKGWRWEGRQLRLSNYSFFWILWLTCLEKSQIVLFFLNLLVQFVLHNRQLKISFEIFGFHKGHQ